MRIPNRLVIIFQFCLTAFFLSSCDKLGVSQTGRAELEQTPTGTVFETESPPLFAPQSKAMIEPENASFLSPSTGIVVPGANEFVWLPRDEGAVVAGDLGVQLLPTMTQAIPGTQSGALQATWTVLSGEPSNLVVAKDVAVIAWVSGGRSISLLDMASFSGEPTNIQSEDPITSLTLSVDGNHLAYATFTSQIVIREPGEVNPLQVWSVPAWLSDLSYSPDGTQIAGADLANFTFYFLDASSGEVLHQIEWKESATLALSGVYLSPNWELSAWVEQSAVQLVNTKDGDPGALLLHQDVVKALAWSPNNNLIATGAAASVNNQIEPVVTIWNPIDGTVLNTLVQSAAIQSLEFSPDGRQLAVLDVNGKLQTWSVSR